MKLFRPLVPERSEQAFSLIALVTGTKSLHVIFSEGQRACLFNPMDYII
jgi:hypothetical protein